MYFETSTECNTDKINHDTTLQKYLKAYVSNEKNSKMPFETLTDSNFDKINHDTTLEKIF
jgi:hypothetical protein